MSRNKPENTDSLTHADPEIKRSLAKKHAETATAAPAQAAEIQVKSPRNYRPRRSFDSAYKEKILAAYEACLDSNSRGELLRREGLYYSVIGSWKSQQAAGKLKRNHRRGHGKYITRADHLIRENDQLKKKLAQAEAVIDLQKKVSDLFGQHILPHKKNEVS